VIREVVLDDWHDADHESIARAAGEATDSLDLTIGLASREPPAKLRPLVTASTLTLADFPCEEPEFVTMPDVPEALKALCDVAKRHPQASVVLGQLLRQTEQLTVLSGLAAEAAAYSMLLGGGEFANWLAHRPAVRSSAPNEPVHLVRDGDRLLVVLDDPQRRNALGARMRAALFEALEVAVLDDTIRQVELSGAGTAFCSGGDLAEFGTARDLVAAYLVRLDHGPWRLVDRVRDKVTVRIEGAAVGAGAELAAFAGRVVASPDAFFQLPEIGMGLVPGAGGTVSVPRRIGRWRAAWMMLTGTRVSATTALDWGLADELSC
jgi:hypothetical protein